MNSRGGCCVVVKPEFEAITSCYYASFPAFGFDVSKCNVGLYYFISRMMAESFFILGIQYLLSGPFSAWGRSSVFVLLVGPSCTFAPRRLSLCLPRVLRSAC